MAPKDAAPPDPAMVTMFCCMMACAAYAAAFSSVTPGGRTSKLDFFLRRTIFTGDLERERRDRRREDERSFSRSRSLSRSRSRSRSPALRREAPRSRSLERREAREERPLLSRLRLRSLRARRAERERLRSLRSPELRRGGRAGALSLAGSCEARRGEARRSEVSGSGRSQGEGALTRASSNWRAPLLGAGGGCGCCEYCGACCGCGCAWGCAACCSCCFFIHAGSVSSRPLPAMAAAVRRVRGLQEARGRRGRRGDGQADRRDGVLLAWPGDRAAGCEMGGRRVLIQQRFLRANGSFMGFLLVSEIMARA